MSKKPNITPEQIEKALHLQRRGWTHERIADELGIHRVTVTRHLSAINNRALAKIVDRVASEKVRQVGHLLWVADEAIQAWERSKRLGKKRKRKSTTIEVGSGTERIEAPADEITREVVLRDGNPAFLSEAQAALDRIAKRLGIDASAELAREEFEWKKRQSGLPSALESQSPQDTIDELKQRRQQLRGEQGVDQGNTGGEPG